MRERGRPLSTIRGKQKKTFPHRRGFCKECNKECRDCGATKRSLSFIWRMSVKAVFLTCLVASAYAVSDQEQQSAEQQSADKVGVEELGLTREPEIHVDDNGHFTLRLTDDDGSMFEEEGVVLTNEKTGEEVVIVKKGVYSIPDENGKLVKLAYDVDEPPIASSTLQRSRSQIHARSSN
ncbi:uncharacterized protein [Neodiprion pinetum]|uniref:uncharacterized protein n=1 Tax=Neodiprion pinetum TaxID=441929 RepID=UPI0037246340